MTTNSHTRVASETDVREKLADAPTIFLSASVPYERGLSGKPGASERKSLQTRNKHYLDNAEPARVRSAVIALTRATLMRNARLVFGAHPSISPMVLAAARDVQAPKGSVLIFQSDYFEGSLPNSTLELASWESGLLILTRADRPQKNQSDDDRRANSLKRMRELMVSVPGLRACVFVGGMEGVPAEAGIVRERHPKLPLYALASTGSGARDLWEEDPKRYSGNRTEAAKLLGSASYSVVANRILDDVLPKRQEKGER
jgi:SLOG cluster3 family